MGTKWNGDAGHSQWQSDMTSCGTKCLGKGSCVTSCMSGKGWSSGCATCFGNLADCTSKNCLAKCINGRTPDCVTCLKAAGCDTAAFGAGSCTGFDAPSLAIQTTSSCTDADTTKWNGDAGHSQWQSDMTSCGTKCLGRASCVTSCMTGKGWSSGCATCFGNLAGCTAQHCLTKCLGGRTPGCVSCLKAAGCDTAAFGAGSCTGFDAPSTAALTTAASQCSADDTTKWNGDSGHSQWQSDMTSCGTKCLGKGACVTSCMGTKGWSSGCTTCFGNLAGCTAQH